MSVPLYDDGHTAQNTLYNPCAGTACFIAAKTSKAELAKDFLRFASTTQAMRIFNTTTGQVRPYEYELTEEEYNGLTDFSQSLYTMLHIEDNAVANKLSTNEVMAAEANYFYQWQFKSKIGTKTYSEIFNAFYNNPTLTVQQYLDGKQAQYSDWSSALAAYLK